MKLLTRKQLAAWKQIAEDKKHPWYSLALQAIWRNEQRKKINKVIKETQSI